MMQCSACGKPMERIRDVDKGIYYYECRNCWHIQNEDGSTYDECRCDFCNFGINPKYHLDKPIQW